jgi:hypothetical protein
MESGRADVDSQIFHHLLISAVVPAGLERCFANIPPKRTHGDSFWLPMNAVVRIAPDARRGRGSANGWLDKNVVVFSGKIHMIWRSRDPDSGDLTERDGRNYLDFCRHIEGIGAFEFPRVPANLPNGQYIRTVKITKQWYRNRISINDLRIEIIDSRLSPMSEIVLFSISNLPVF